MSYVESFPAVHAAFGVYMEYFKTPPQNATILVKWCQKQSISGIKYANVNKYLRLRKNDFKEEKKKKPVVKSSTQKYKTVPDIKKSNTTRDLLSRFNQAMEESKKTYTSHDLGFDKGQTKSTNFNTKFFEEQVQKEKETASKTHTSWKKRNSLETKDIPISLKNELKEEDILSKYNDNEIDEELGVDNELINELCKINNVDDFDFTSKYVRRNEPWLRLKLYWTENSRMSKDSSAVEELKEWLEKNKFGQFFDKLYECGVESLADLRCLKNDEEITELAGPQGISMGVVFRRKFIKAVNNLKSEQPSKTTKEIEENPQTEPPQDNNNNESKKTGVSQIEKESLDRLVESIKNLTFELRGSRNELKFVKEQTSKVRSDIAETFDKAIGILVMRRKLLETSLNELEEDTSRNIKGNVINLQKSAKALLICKSKIESKIKTLPNDDDRSNIVQNEVQEALNTIPDKKPTPNILFDKGSTDVVSFLESYGQIRKDNQNETVED